MTIIEALQQAKDGDKISLDKTNLIIKDGTLRHDTTGLPYALLLGQIVSEKWIVIHTHTPEEIESLRQAMLEAAQLWADSQYGNCANEREAWFRAHKAYLAAERR